MFLNHCESSWNKRKKAQSERCMHYVPLTEWTSVMIFSHKPFMSSRGSNLISHLRMLFLIQKAVCIANGDYSELHKEATVFPTNYVTHPEHIKANMYFTVCVMKGTKWKKHDKRERTMFTRTEPWYCCYFSMLCNTVTSCALMSRFGVGDDSQEVVIHLHL